MIEANDADDAISRYLVANESELVSLVRPARCRESIATVKKRDSIFLLRVSAG